MISLTPYAKLTRRHSTPKSHLDILFGQVHWRCRCESEADGNFGDIRDLVSFLVLRRRPGLVGEERFLLVMKCRRGGHRIHAEQKASEINQFLQHGF